MNNIHWGKLFWMPAVFGAMAIGCASSDGGNGSPSAGAQPTPLAIAERFVALNAKADSELNLVARKYLNNGTEVAMFHEPLAGHVMFSVAGSPLGPSVLRPDLINGKTASELWALVAPGEPVPEPLAQAIERSKNPAPVSQSSRVGDVRPAGPQSGAPAPAVQANGETLLSGGYCTSQFWADWGNIGNGAPLRTSSVFNWGWYDVPYTNVYQSQFGACPLGDVSNLGGVLTMHFPDGTNPSWNLPPDYFLVTGVWTANTSCSFDLSCICCGSVRCWPGSFDIEGRFDSQCFLNQGASCGDDFDWISWATWKGSYCG